jgi:hypothetical protein
LKCHGLALQEISIMTQMQQLNARAVVVLDYMEKNDWLAQREAVGGATSGPDGPDKVERYTEAKVTHLWPLIYHHS